MERTLWQSIGFLIQQIFLTQFRKLVINFHIAGYSISLLALLISLSIFISFK